MEEREVLARYFAMPDPGKRMMRAMIHMGIIPIMCCRFFVELLHGFHLAFRTARLAAAEELISYRRIERLTRPGKHQ